jgi:hypothetical protein
MPTCMCGCGRNLGLRPWRRTAHNYWRTASMLTGVLRFADRIQPGWIDEPNRFGPMSFMFYPGGPRKTGEVWCETFLSAAHGEGTLRGVDYSLWIVWRDAAFTTMMAFRAEFDPHDNLKAYAVAHDMEFEELCRRLGDPDGPNPLAEEPGAREYMRDAREATRRLIELFADRQDSAPPEEALKEAYEKGQGVLHELAAWTHIATVAAAEAKGNSWEEAFEEVRRQVDEYTNQIPESEERAKAIDGQARAANLVLEKPASDSMRQQINDAVADPEIFWSVFYPLLSMATLAIAQRGVARGVPFEDHMADFLPKARPADGTVAT